MAALVVANELSHTCMLAAGSVHTSTHVSSAYTDLCTSWVNANNEHVEPLRRGITDAHDGKLSLCRAGKISRNIVACTQFVDDNDNIGSVWRIMRDV